MMIVVSCGGFGCAMGSEYRKTERQLSGLMRALKSMQWDLQYRLTSLPELCLLGGKQAGGAVGWVLNTMGERLESLIAPDVESVAAQVLSEKPLSDPACRLLRELGSSLGRYDLSGQLDGLSCVMDACKEQQDILKEGRDLRLRNYRTLGLCAGAALAILML